MITADRTMPGQHHMLCHLYFALVHPLSALTDKTWRKWPHFRDKSVEDWRTYTRWATKK